MPAVRSLENPPPLSSSSFAAHLAHQTVPKSAGASKKSASAEATESPGSPFDPAPPAPAPAVLAAVLAVGLAVVGEGEGLGGPGEGAWDGLGEGSRDGGGVGEGEGAWVTARTWTVQQLATAGSSPVLPPGLARPARPASRAGPKSGLDSAASTEAARSGSEAKPVSAPRLATYSKLTATACVRNLPAPALAFAAAADAWRPPGPAAVASSAARLTAEATSEGSATAATPATPPAEPPAVLVRMLVRMLVRRPATRAAWSAAWPAAGWGVPTTRAVKCLTAWSGSPVAAPSTMRTDASKAPNGRLGSERSPAHSKASDAATLTVSAAVGDGVGPKVRVGSEVGASTGEGNGQGSPKKSKSPAHFCLIYLIKKII